MWLNQKPKFQLLKCFTALRRFSPASSLSTFLTWYLCTFTNLSNFECVASMVWSDFFNNVFPFNSKYSGRCSKKHPQKQHYLDLGDGLLLLNHPTFWIFCHSLDQHNLLHDKLLSQNCSSSQNFCWLSSFFTMKNLGFLGYNNWWSKVIFDSFFMCLLSMCLFYWN